jgi:hypothetical protein
MTNAKTNGASPDGYNVYRFVHETDMSQQTFIGYAETLEAAERMCRSNAKSCPSYIAPSYQIQHGLDGEVTHFVW